MAQCQCRGHGFDPCSMAPHSSPLAWKSHGWRSLVGCSPWGRTEPDMTERLHFHFSFHALEKEMATHSSVLAWKIPGTGEPGGLPSMGSHRVGHDWSNLAAASVSLVWPVLSNSASENENWSSHLGKHCNYLVKLKSPLFYDPTVSFLFIYHYDTVFSNFLLSGYLYALVLKHQCVQ